MPLHLARTLPTVAIAAGCLLLGSTGGAVAGSMITGAQIKNNTVTTKDLKDQTVATADLAPATISSLKGATGPAGPAGATGPTGPQGVPGTAGVSGYQIVTATSPTAAAGAAATVSASCPAGKKAVGAGSFWLSSSTAPQLYPTGAGTSPTTWVAEGPNTSSVSDAIRLSVVCVTAG